MQFKLQVQQHPQLNGLQLLKLLFVPKIWSHILYVACAVGALLWHPFVFLPQMLNLHASTPLPAIIDTFVPALRIALPKLSQVGKARTC